MHQMVRMRPYLVLSVCMCVLQIRPASAQKAQLGVWSTIDHLFYAEKGHGDVSVRFVQLGYGGRVSLDLTERFRVVFDLGGFNQTVTTRQNYAGYNSTTRYERRCALLELGGSIRLGASSNEWEARVLFAAVTGIVRDARAYAVDTLGTVLWESREQGRDMIGVRGGVRLSRKLAKSFRVFGEGSFLFTLRDGPNYVATRSYAVKPNVPDLFGAASLRLGVEYYF